MMIDELAREIVNAHQGYLNVYSVPQKRVLKGVPVVSFDVVRETIITTMDFLESEQVVKSECAGMLASNIADVTGIEYLDVYKVIMKNGGKQWTTK